MIRKTPVLYVFEIREVKLDTYRRLRTYGTTTTVSKIRKLIPPEDGCRGDTNGGKHQLFIKHPSIKL